MDALVEQPVRSQPASEPGVVAASVYAGWRRVADIAIDEAGEWSEEARSRRLDWSFGTRS